MKEETGGDAIGEPRNFKIWKDKNGWSASVHIPASVFGCSSRARALKDLDKLIKEMADCDETCGCPPFSETLKKK